MALPVDRLPAGGGAVSGGAVFSWFLRLVCGASVCIVLYRSVGARASRLAAAFVAGRVLPPLLAMWRLLVRRKKPASSDGSGWSFERLTLSVQSSAAQQSRREIAVVDGASGLG